MFDKAVFVPMAHKSGTFIPAKEVLFFRKGPGVGKLSNMLFIQPGRHDVTMSFPGMGTNKSGRRSQQINYDTFIGTMAELVQKYGNI